MAKTIGELIEMINVEKDRVKLYRWYQNAHTKKNPEIMSAAFKRAIELRADGFDPKGDFENAVYHALAGYEMALAIKHKERTAAIRTRSLLRRLEPLKALKYLMNSTDEKFGLKLLSNMKLAEFTFESVVVTYHKRFKDEEVIEAQRRLDEIFENRPKEFIYPKFERNIF
jgi:hypothetical protein